MRRFVWLEQGEQGGEWERAGQGEDRDLSHRALWAAGRVCRMGCKKRSYHDLLRCSQVPSAGTEG